MTQLSDPDLAAWLNKASPIRTTGPITAPKRPTTEERAIDAIERLVACLPPPECRSERELVAERAVVAIERLRALLDHRRACGGWAELSHG